MRRESGLIDFLKPLHKDNEAIMSFAGKDNAPSRRTYYRGIGNLNTKKKKRAEVDPAYFKTRNSIRLPKEFEKHKIDFGSDEYHLLRGDRFLHRYFISRDYGVANQLEYDFEFQIEPEKGHENKPVKGDTVFKLLRFLFEMRVNTEDRKATPPEERYRFWEIGEDWLPGIVAGSTRRRSHPKGVVGEEVVGCAATAVVVYEEGELAELPSPHTHKYTVRDHKNNVDISWFDYETQGGSNEIKVYFIRVNKENRPSPDFISDLVSALFDLRESYVYLHEALCKRTQKGNVHRSFKEVHLKNIEGIRDSEEYGFLFPHEVNSNKIYDPEKREEISKQCADYKIRI